MQARVSFVLTQSLLPLPALDPSGAHTRENVITIPCWVKQSQPTLAGG